MFDSSPISLEKLYGEIFTEKGKYLQRRLMFIHYLVKIVIKKIIKPYKKLWVYEVLVFQGLSWIQGRGGAKRGQCRERAAGGLSSALW